MKTRRCFDLLVLGLTLVLLPLVGCKEFDSTDIWDKITDLDNRLARLEVIVDKMNSNISSLQEIAIALQKNDAVTGIVTLPDNAGYTIVFVSGKKITLYNGTNGTNGTDGENGHTPVVSIKQDTDGQWYWTLDGEWLIVDGGKVRAAAKDGKDGEDGENGSDGITPKLKVEEGYWYISYDNGSTWTQLDKATGEDGKDGKDGDSLFKGIEIRNGYLFITLNDTNSTVIQIPMVTDEGTVVKTGDASDLWADHAFLDGYCNLDGVEGASVYYGVQISCYDLNSIDWPLWYMLQREGWDSWYNVDGYGSYNRWDSFAGNHEDKNVPIGCKAFLYLGKNKDDNGHYTIMADYLSPDTKYYYRSFVYDGAYRYGEAKSFTTPAVLVSSITTEEATDVEKFAATLHASVEANIFIDRFESGFVICTLESLMNDIVAQSRLQFTRDEIINYRAEKIRVYQTASLPGQLDANLKNLIAGAVYYYVSFIDLGETVLFGGIKSFSTQSYYSGQEIQLDGNFSDWELIDPSNIAIATCDPEAYYTALETVKVYTNKDFVFVYFEWDKTQISHSNGERVPFHCYINTDGNTATGGYGSWEQSGGFTDACSDVLLEGYLYDQYGYLGRYSPWAFAWSGEPNAAGWEWDIKLNSSIYGFGTGAGIEGQYELAISREALAGCGYPISDEFTVGFDIQQNWTSKGMLPNAAVTDGNPKGLASSLKMSKNISSPEAIDMGLSVKWASFNLGASSPEEYGDYFAWGELESYYSALNPLTWKDGKSHGYTTSSYKWCNGSQNKLTKYCPEDRFDYWDGEGSPDGKIVLDTDDDPARYNLGGQWRLPTYDEAEELRKKCNTEWTTEEGVYGYRFTSRVNGNSIFLPAAGYWENTELYGDNTMGRYWSSSLDTTTGPSYESGPNQAWTLAFNNDDYGAGIARRVRTLGFPIRPVTE